MHQEKIQQFQDRLDHVNAELQKPEVYSSPAAAALVNEQRELEAKLSLFSNLARAESELVEAKKLLEDKEMAELASTEITILEEEIEDINEQIRRALVPTDPNDQKSAIMEIRAGAGGDESSLFAGELARMYSRYAETHGLKLELMSESPGSVGGYKEVIFEITGPNAYGKLKYESGVHRVQRVPETESAGRIHTSTVTVAVLPEAEENDIEISPSDLRIDVFRSSGHGGQSVNTTDSAVRITHLPTGIVVTCQDEKSQLKNKTKALSVLRSRLLAIKEEEERKAQGEARLSQIGTGDRSEKIRTYNFPQDRLTDHRINYTTHNLTRIMDGEIEELFEKLTQADVDAALEKLQ